MSYTPINYRKIYETAFGKIPKEPDGRSYQIHHIDGNRNNNNLENLQCVTLLEHYHIHKSQGDYSAAARLAITLKLSPEVISELSRKNALEKIANGTHHWLGDTCNRKRIENGTHPLIKRPDGTSQTSDRVKDGSHPWLKRSDGGSFSSDKVKDRTHHMLNKTGKDHHNYNHTRYSFKNKETGEIIVMTRHDFIKTYNLFHSNVTALIKGRLKSVSGFVMYKEEK